MQNVAEFTGGVVHVVVPLLRIECVQQRALQVLHNNITITKLLLNNRHLVAHNFTKLDKRLRQFAILRATLFFKRKRLGHSGSFKRRTQSTETFWMGTTSTLLLKKVSIKLNIKQLKVSSLCSDVKQRKVLLEF